MGGVTGVSSMGRVTGVAFHQWAESLEFQNKLIVQFILLINDLIMMEFSSTTSLA